ncbi:class I SAM-dependent methyltransferase [Desulfobulbus rhabdoformis]|uniref:class I SAM-dependent methyltransferase n=1 Tax=Desulfobulbus rhabdoformis TaxID=34032 RepID=UPI0019626031|nr:class I SAM-dependent methyltransferase [Desulfobulbus rhabdoformis]MBM9615533.1 class I SAM-dependent methyltransferase [Desulfobulbus rhabdoformis]
MKINAKQFDAIARTVFAPVYPVIAEQIIFHTGITRGTCLDLGCGSGYLGAAVARKTKLDMVFLDQSPEMLKLCARTIDENGLRGRAGLLPGDTGSIALPDGSVDLVISRGSIFFWEDLPQAFREIKRVLAPGGKTFIGGGFGNALLKQSIRLQMAERNQGKDQFGQKMRTNLGAEMRNRFEKNLHQAGISNYSILHDEDIGLWIMMEQPATPAVNKETGCIGAQ